MNFSLEAMGPHGSPYLRIAIFILLFLAVRIIFIIASHYFDYIFIRKFIIRIKMIINKENDSNLIKSIHELDDKNKDLSIIEKIQKIRNRDIYSHFKSELINLIINVDRTDIKDSLSSNLMIFYIRIKEKFFSKLTEVKSIIFFSLLVELYAIVVGLNFIAKSDPYHGKNGITFKIALMMMNDIVFSTGILLIVTLFLSLWGYFSIKKKYYFLIDETDILINLIFKITK